MKNPKTFGLIGSNGAIPNTSLIVFGDETRQDMTRRLAAQGAEEVRYFPKENDNEKTMESS